MSLHLLLVSTEVSSAHLPRSRTQVECGTPTPLKTTGPFSCDCTFLASPQAPRSRYEHHQHAMQLKNKGTLFRRAHRVVIRKHHHPGAQLIKVLAVHMAK